MNRNTIDQEVDSIQTYIEIQKLFHEKKISISTMTITASVGTCIDTRLFYKYVQLCPDAIVQITAMEEDEPVLRTAITRSIIHKCTPDPECKKKNRKMPKRAFDNQVTLLMKIAKRGSNYKNAKLFGNGSIQMTGCRDIDEVQEVVFKLIEILKKGRERSIGPDRYLVDYIRPIDPSMDKVIVPKKSDQIRPVGQKLIGRKIRNRMAMHNCKVHMINSNFKVDFLIDRSALERVLGTHYRHVPFVPRSEENPYASAATVHKDHYRLNAINDPSGTHACVNICYPYDDNNNSHIFVFYTGSINITGATAHPHILEAHRFITGVLDRHRKEIELPVITIPRLRKAVRNVLRKARTLGMIR